MLGVLLAVALTQSGAPVPLGGDYWRGTEPKAGEVWGVADLHAHFFNYLGFGGRVLHGTPWAPNGMRQALRRCRAHHGEDDHGFSTAILPEPRHPTSGYPAFEGWPRWDTSVHQQAYVDWIRRAWQGGLRVVQVDVQNTPFLGATYATVNALFVDGERTLVARDDRSALALQVGAARQFFGEGGPAADFAGLAHTPAEARALIRAGKLAVILGIEVESLEAVGATPDAGVDELVRSTIDALEESGVVHVIPIHLQRNAFGHPAVFNPVLNAMNFGDTGDFYATSDAFDAGIRFDPRFASGSGAASPFELLGAVQGKPAFSAGARAIAAREGLSEAGRTLVRALLRRGFLVDVQHMSMLGADEALSIAEEEGVPVMSSHASFIDLAFGARVTFLDGGFEAAQPALPFAASPSSYGTSDALKVANEMARTRRQLSRLRALGGIVGVPLAGRGIGVSWRDRVPLDCDQSSKSFAQALAYAEETMGDEGAVAVATDVGGFALLPAPRFGVEACPGAEGDALRGGDGKRRAQALAQRDGVHYRTPTPSVGQWLVGRKPTPWTDAELRTWLESQTWSDMKGPNAPLERSVAGKRSFDVNLDGMAHYGMLPDFLQDLANVTRAANAPELVPPLFRSAEGYLQMWERVEQRRRRP